MFRRRIEITRERSTWFSVRDTTVLLCRGCGVVPDLVLISEAAAHTGLPLPEINAAVVTGRLDSWNAGEHRFVCLRCSKNLERNNRHA
jgi:hypothetical protein